MNRVESLARDVLVRVVDRRASDHRGDARARGRTRRSRCADRSRSATRSPHRWPCSVAPLFARRRFPFAAPASYWLYRDGASRSSTERSSRSWSASFRSDWRRLPAREPARRLKRAWAGLAIVLGGIIHSRLQHPRPPHRRAHRHSDRFRHQLGGRFCPTRPRAEGGGGRDPRDPGRTRARGGRTRRGRGGAGTDRARATRHRRPRGERDGAPGRRGQASASRRAG